MSKRWGLLIQGVALVGVAALVATLVVVVRTTGPSLPSAPTQPLQVGLDAPSNADMAETIPVAISAVGPDPVQRIELWVGPAIVDAVELENLGETSSVTLHWQALAPGEATTLARAFDSAGRVGTSNTAVTQIGSSPPLAQTIDDPNGASLAQLASGTGTDPEVAVALNPGADGSEILVQGSSVLLPSQSPSPSPSPQPPPGPSQTLELDATVAGCEVSLTVAGLTEPERRSPTWALELLRVSGQGGSPVIVDTTTEAATEVVVTDSPGPGIHLFSAEERDGGGSVSPMVEVEVPETCTGSSPGGSEGLFIEDGVLHVGDPVDGVFVYLRFDGMVTRAPGDPGELIGGPGHLFDLRAVLPPVPDTDIEVEVWGRVGGDIAQLGNLHLAGSALATPHTALEALISLEMFDLTVPVKTITANNKQTVEFQWSSNVAHDGVRWFLASQKPGPAGALAPVGLRQTGVATPEDGQNRFEVDLTENDVPTVIQQPVNSLPMTDAPVGLPAGAGNTRQLPGPQPDAPGTTWVWAVPVDVAGDPVGPPSNPVQVVITQAPFDPSEAPPFDVLNVEVTIPPAPNPALSNCVRIVSQSPPFPRFLGGLGVYHDGTPVPVGGTKITGTLPYTLDETGVALYPFTACPGEKGNFQWGDVGCGADPFCHLAKGALALGEAAQQALEFVVDLANGVADAYNQLKAWVIDLVASTLCPKTVSGPCKTLINVAVDALLASVGVPPTMPNFNDVADLAKGEVVDLALDQLGVGAACDAVAGGVTGKTCGQLVTDLENLDACSLAPEGQEDNCRQLVEDAQEICNLATNAAECESLTADARDLVEEGMGQAYDLAVEATEAQVTKAMGEVLGIGLDTSYSTTECVWGGPDGAQVICPPIPLFGDLPAGCHLGTIGQTEGKVVCAKPPPDTVAIPEPLGLHQPMRVDVLLERNDNPLPDEFQCSPIQASATTVTPRGAVGEPYLAASSPISGEILPGTGLYSVTLWLHEPNPLAEIPADKRPPPPAAEATQSGDIGTTQQVLTGVGPGYDWKYLLEGGSYVGVKVSGDCIPETHADGPFGVAGQIPQPQARITPGAS